MTQELKPIIAGKYLLEWEIDAGAMGRVFAATQLGLDRPVALKLMSEATREFRERFLVEAHTLARLNHRHVVTIFDAGETRDGLVFIVMEYLRGRTLAEVLKTEHRLEPLRALAIAAQVTKGLRAAHRQRIVHRDLKPSNVFLVDDEDDVEIAKVFDFGIAKAPHGAPFAVQTRAGVIVGTPSYMAPEQIEGAAVDARTDIYALGVVLFQMLTGRTPFIESTRRELLLAHLMKPPPPLRAVCASVPQELEALVARFLAKDPGHRPAGADDALSELSDLLVRLGGDAFRLRNTDVFDGGGAATRFPSPAGVARGWSPGLGDEDTAAAAAAIDAAVDAAFDGVLGGVVGRLIDDDDTHAAPRRPADPPPARAALSPTTLGRGARTEQLPALDEPEPPWVTRARRRAADAAAAAAKAAAEAAPAGRFVPAHASLVPLARTDSPSPLTPVLRTTRTPPWPPPPEGDPSSPLSLDQSRSAAPRARPAPSSGQFPLLEPLRTPLSRREWRMAFFAAFIATLIVAGIAIVVFWFALGR